MDADTFDHQVRPGIYLQSPETLVDPFPTYAYMRKHHPVCQVEPGGIWAVTCFDDVKYVLATPEIFSSKAINLLNESDWLSDESKHSRLIIAQDPPDHSLYHGMVNRAFISRVITTLEPLMRETAKSLMQQFDDSAPVDFVENFAYPYVGKITRNIMGVGEKQSLAEIREWVDLEERSSPIRPDDAFIAAFEHAILRQNGHFLEVIEERRANPQDDLITRLVNAEAEGKKLTDKQLCGVMSLVVSAGFATTVHMLNHAVMQLSQRPDLMAHLVASPDRISSFIEELLRYSPSVFSSLRSTTKDTEVSGVTIPKDALVMPLIASANRDTSQFANADVFDITRPKIKQHFTFGHGIHTCIGAALARAELRIALEVVLSKFTQFTCPADDQLLWKDSMFVRGVSALPVTFR